ncbi:hypothetical protein PoB_007686000 [Plakobranchus ocellatus]|uniref:Uncharacterized protein n=1 Tax=Plakobranchus ocellatus TaxID=259542 RepID=A0AAV4E1W8_9GAST|nr:hypothetical protein PoB_007686000 [Plakobranchus ocellatus]
MSTVHSLSTSATVVDALCVTHVTWNGPDGNEGGDDDYNDNNGEGYDDDEVGKNGDGGDDEDGGDNDADEKGYTKLVRMVMEVMMKMMMKMVVIMMLMRKDN